MKIYLACTIRGDRTRVSVARAVADYLMTAGHDVLTARFLDDNAEDEDGRLSAQQVFTRDIAWLNECDALVAEASGSSYGVGFEVGYLFARAATTRQKTIVLFDRRRLNQVSRLISGMAGHHAASHGYESADDAVTFVAQQLSATG
jgi:nucleoside 2-deoxyribosyltransferase